MDLRRVKVAPTGTHHEVDGQPIYDRRFHWVLKFHDPGLAPVKNGTGSYHITVDGKPAYSKRYIKTFGFYLNKAAVITSEGWGHIRPNGELIYPAHFAWVGNFQEERCPVRTVLGLYFHIDPKGNPLYEEQFRYVGDFKDDIAVARLLNGLCIHIHPDGSQVHEKTYLDLDIYHKDFARARDDHGWFHVDRSGEPLYEARYRVLEPFYNGHAYVRTFDGMVGIIDEGGSWIHTVHEEGKD